MKLSEYMKIGAREVDETEGVFIKWGPKGTIKAACPLCTAIVGSEMRSELVVGMAYWPRIMGLLDELDIDRAKLVENPVDHHYSDLAQTVIDLTDHWHWKRNDVIEWLEGIGE